MSPRTSGERGVNQNPFVEKLQIPGQGYDDPSGCSSHRFPGAVLRESFARLYSTVTSLFLSGFFMLSDASSFFVSICSLLKIFVRQVVLRLPAHFGVELAWPNYVQAILEHSERDENKHSVSS